MHDPLELGGNGGDHARMTVAEIEHPDPADEIQIFAPVGIPHTRALGAFNEQIVGNTYAASNFRALQSSQKIGIVALEYHPNKYGKFV
jgi:hypothetical protein